MNKNAKEVVVKRATRNISNTIEQLKTFLSLRKVTDIPDRLKSLWEHLISSYWFIPTVCVLLGIFLAPVFVTIDEHFSREEIKDFAFIFTGDDDAARAIMTAIAGAVLGVAGTTFSITIAVLSMASSQFGPRLLRNFLTDTPNQFVLGAFIGTFSYSLLVLKSIHKFDVSYGVPQLSVTFAIAMAIVCALLLVYFVQHMVHAIQASRVIQDACNDALENIYYWYSDSCDVQHQRDVEHASIDTYKQWQATPIYAPVSGYLQQIYLESLITLSQDYGGVIQLHTNLGNFVTDKNIMGYFYQRPDDHPFDHQKTTTPHLIAMPRTPDGQFWQRFASCIRLEPRLVHSSDIAYSLGQMTEIAVRALSPGINDPKTAVNCVQSLTISLGEMMRRQPPSPYHFYTPEHSSDAIDITLNQPRVAILAVVTQIPTISDFIDVSLGEIRRYAISDLMVLKALCQAMTDLSYSCVNSAQQQTLLHEITLIERAGEENLNYSELVDDLVAMCKQATQFIQSEESVHQHFRYMSGFAVHISEALQTQSS